MVTKSRSGNTTTLSGNVGTAAEATIAPTVASEATPPAKAAPAVRFENRRRGSRLPFLGELNKDLRILPPQSGEHGVRPGYGFAAAGMGPCGRATSSVSRRARGGFARLAYVTSRASDGRTAP